MSRLKVVVAPDSFKECLSAPQVAEAMADGVRAAAPDAQVTSVPMADGGEGTVQALVAATGGALHNATVTGPLGEPVEAEFGILGDGETAVIEMAAASGLPLVPPERRDPTRTTTFGTGELIRAALDRGARHLILGIGGSATVDGGAGMAQALGVRLLGAEGQPLGRGGGALERLDTIDLSGRDPRPADVTCEVASDVDNPLIGPRGAARVYAPQKGATPQMVESLEANLTRLADVVERDLDVQVRDLPGAGAAGGLGAGLVAFLGAALRPGVELVIEAVHLDEALAGADLALVGEGQLDGQTAFGKVPVGVARVAAKQDIPVVALAGALGDGWEAVLDEGITACLPIADGPMGREASYKRASELLTRTAEQVTRLFLAGALSRATTDRSAATERKSV
jgi:glycerate kinase